MAILDAHFPDPSEKLSMFPTIGSATNFIDKLIRWPNQYWSYFALYAKLADVKLANPIGPTCIQIALGRKETGEIDRKKDWEPSTVSNDI